MKTRIILILIFLSFNLQAQIPELWGMTRDGGTYNGGTIFKINGDGSYFQTVHSFDTLVGNRPWGNLCKASNGLLYGVTCSGGAYDSGDLFSIDPVTFNFTNLYTFHHLDTINGSNPQGTLMQASNGLLYGMTTNGGIPQGLVHGGTIFSYDIALNQLTTIYRFIDSTGHAPYYGKLLEYHNLLYGLTYFGGAGGHGVIFSIDPVTLNYNKLYDFNTFCSSPQGSLICDDSNGMFYGLGLYGTSGAPATGAIFNFNPITNSVGVLYNFVIPKGYAPNGSPLLLNNGKIYGTASIGGSASGGVLFEFNLNSFTYDTLINFDCSTGCGPHGSLIQASDGRLYGTTGGGGINSVGTVFSFNHVTNAINYLFNFNGNNGKFPPGDLIEVTTVTSEVNSISKSNLDFTVYPNPATDDITISISSPKQKLIIQFLDNTGRIIKEVTLNELRKKISISDLTPGIYFINVVGNTPKPTRIIKL